MSDRRLGEEEAGRTGGRGGPAELADEVERSATGEDVPE